jgi:outer membrane protein TolC
MPTVADAVTTALESRADLKEQEERTASAKLKNSAAKLERLPSIIGYGDYGLLSGVQTHVVGATLKIPLFDGGRMESDRAQALHLMRKEETEEEELRRRVELEIRKLRPHWHRHGSRLRLPNKLFPSPTMCWHTPAGYTRPD